MVAPWLAWALLSGCDSGPDKASLVDELRVVAVEFSRPEVVPGDSVTVATTVLDPQGLGFDVVGWFCTPLSGRCAEAGASARPLSEWSYVERGAGERTERTFRIPSELAALASTDDSELSIFHWTLACPRDTCTLIDEVESAPEAGSPEWSALLEKLLLPSGIAREIPFEGASLTLKTVLFSARPSFDRLRNPDLAYEGPTPLYASPGEVLEVPILSSAPSVYPFTTLGLFEFSSYGQTGPALSLRWFAPDSPGVGRMVFVGEDGLGGTAVDAVDVFVE